MFTEAHFVIRHDWTVQLMSDQVPVYAYELHHRGEHSLVNIFLEGGLDLPQAYNCKTSLQVLTEHSYKGIF